MTDHTSYHFDCGNSSRGPIGFCARVCAHDQQGAIDLVNGEMGQEIELKPGLPGLGSYFNVYLGVAVTVDDIDDEEPCDCDAYEHDCNDDGEHDCAGCEEDEETS